MNKHFSFDCLSGHHCQDYCVAQHENLRDSSFLESSWSSLYKFRVFTVFSRRQGQISYSSVWKSFNSQCCHFQNYSQLANSNVLNRSGAHV